MDLHIFWFVLLGILLAGYAILDGFDLGVGIMHLFARTDEERRIQMNSIGPLWDGNTVWLVTFGGALFAAFPEAYATAFSGFYTPFMALLFALIFRVVSMEFRSKHEGATWRAFWDTAFSAASTLATFLYGVAVGNAMEGMAINENHEFVGTTLGLLRPYPILVGLFAVATFAMHGSIYLYLKTEGPLQERVHRWMWRTFFLFLTGYIAVSAYTLIDIPHARDLYNRYPWTIIVPILNVLAIANIPRAISQGRPYYAFISSACSIAAFTFLFGMSLFPNLVASRLDPAWSLNVYNAASSEKTLSIMAIIALMGMPFVLSYTIVVYWVFRGKVRLGRFSY